MKVRSPGDEDALEFDLHRIILEEVYSIVYTCPIRKLLSYFQFPIITFKLSVPPLCMERKFSSFIQTQEDDELLEVIQHTQI